MAQIMLCLIIANHLMRIYNMINDNVAVYAQFLAQCREVIGPFDIERLAYDQQYKAQLISSLALTVDDKLFEMAALVNSKLNEETQSTH